MRSSVPHASSVAVRLRHSPAAGAFRFLLSLNSVAGSPTVAVNSTWARQTFGTFVVPSFLLEERISNGVCEEFCGYPATRVVVVSQNIAPKRFARSLFGYSSSVA